MSLIAMVMSFPPAIDAQLKRDSGINFFEYSVLAQLSQPSTHAVPMAQLAQLVGGSISRLSHAASRLEQQGFVRRRVVTGESRCTELELTDTGLAALEDAAPGHVREARRLVFDALSREQVAQLETIAQALTAAASPETSRALRRAIDDSDAGESC